MKGSMASAQVQEDLARLIGGSSLYIEGKVSVIKPEQLHIPENVLSISWQGGQPRSLNSPEETLVTYTGRFNLSRRLKKDPSYPKWYETAWKKGSGNKAVQGCIDYIVTDEKGKPVIVCGTDKPLQSGNPGELSARVVYLGDVTDTEEDPRDAHCYRLLTNEGLFLFKIQLELARV